MFRFKQFTINQERAAMKVGTDGVLLGAWADISESGRILDVGTGTGLIALMAAQRSSADVTGIEIEKEAYYDACDNIKNSRWSSRISVFNTSLQEYNTELKFDAIVSNPPFFVNSLKAPDSSRATARHTDTLSVDDLFRYSAKMLSESGSIHMVLPADNLNMSNKAASESGLFLNRICYVKPTPDIPAKRVLLSYSFYESELYEEELIVEEFGRHKYSQKYIDLTKDFYLKM